MGEEGGINLYGFVLNNPNRYVDLLGLDWTDFLPPWIDTVGDYGAGLGDALSFSLTRKFREANPDYFSADIDSGAYTAGEVTSLAIGSGRLLYAGSAKCLRLIRAPNALERAQKISQARNKLKKAFRFGAFPNARVYPWKSILQRYDNNPYLIIDAATRTSPIFNTGGGIAVGGSLVNYYQYENQFEGH